MSATDPVISMIAEQRILAGSSVDRVAAITTTDLVLAVTTIEFVVATTTSNQIVAVAPVQLVVTTTANQGVGTMATINHVIEIGTGNYRVVALTRTHLDRFEAAEGNRVETTQIDQVVSLAGRNRQYLQRRRRQRNAGFGLAVDSQFDLARLLQILLDQQVLVTVGQ